jgi:phosphoenolpyruvate carboxylase
MSLLTDIQQQAGKVYQDLHFLLDCFREVLEENNAHDLAIRLPWINEIPEMIHLQFRKRDVQLYSIAFQLLNLVEINEAVQQRRHKTDSEGLASVNGLWAQNLTFLKNASISPETIAKTLGKMHIEPVLTAHPTEAKRRTVLEHQRELYLLLVKRENQMYSQTEQEAIRQEIKLTLERLWRTGEIYLEKPDVMSELKSVLHYFNNVFPEVLPILDKDLQKAWETTGFPTELLHEIAHYPRLSFGNWVGGDRDGHPLVTPEITTYTLQALRQNALQIVRKHLLNLLKHLSFAYIYAKAPVFLQERMDTIAQSLGEIALPILAKNKGEVFRQYINLLLAKLEEQETKCTAQELFDDLLLLQKAVAYYGAKNVAYTDVHQVLRIVQTFGFHLAHLDIRQNSHFHEVALAQLLDSAGESGEAFLATHGQARNSFFERELASSRPFAHTKIALQAEALNVTQTYKAIADFTQQYGFEGIGSLIVSMTRHVTDLFAVYLFTREAGLWVNAPDGWASPLPVVPLFETIEDLEQSPEILEAFLAHPFTQRSIALQQKIRNLPAPQQQIMIGYSDSNKAGGILASTMALYQGQRTLSAIGKRWGVEIVFFHGKGGSISRGAGPTHWFVQALPKGTLQGAIRLTEQGETIAQKYAHKVNAAYNIELLMAGNACQTILHHRQDNMPHPFLDTLLKMAQDSKDAYLQLIHHEHFITFFSEATPIDAIEQSKIGSRPSRRTNKRTLADLRAIPWVFAWSQSRFNLTSWYGVGYALEKLQQDSPALFVQFKQAVNDDKDVLLRYILTNVDTSLASSDEQIMQLYAHLVTTPEVKESIFTLIQKEFRRTQQMLDTLLDEPFEKRRKQHFLSSKLRTDAMQALHLSQINLLQKWRTQKQTESPETESTLLSILLTINAIAGALRYTG